MSIYPTIWVIFVKAFVDLRAAAPLMERLNPDGFSVLDLRYILGLIAAILTLYLHKLRQIHVFVDNRKSVLRDAMHSVIAAEPYFLFLIQNIGKNEKVTCYFREILGAEHPAYLCLFDEIKGLRDRYANNHLYGVAAFIAALIIITAKAFIDLGSQWIVVLPGLIISIIMYCAKCLNSFISYLVILAAAIIPVIFTNQPHNISTIISLVSVQFVLFLIVLLSISFYAEGLRGTRFKNDPEQYEALEHANAWAYKKTFKNRSEILRENSEAAKRLKERYEAVRYAIDMSTSELIKNGKPIDSLRVLDVGCGDGQLELLLSPYLNITGIDISSLSIKKAIENNSSTIRSGGNRVFIEMNALNVNKLGRQYDILIMVELLEHFVLAEKQLSKMTTLVRNGGFIIATLPNIKDEYNRKVAEDNRIECDKKHKPLSSRADMVEHFWVDAETGAKFPHKLYSMKSVQTLFSKSGLELGALSIQGIPHDNDSNQNGGHTLLVVANKK